MWVVGTAQPHAGEGEGRCDHRRCQGDFVDQTHAFEQPEHLNPFLFAHLHSRFRAGILCPMSLPRIEGKTIRAGRISTEPTRAEDSASLLEPVVARRSGKAPPHAPR